MKGNQVRLSLYLTSEQGKILKLASIDQEKTMSEIVMELLEKHLPWYEIRRIEDKTEPEIRRKEKSREEIGEPLICGKCEKPKQPDEFYIDKRSKTGRQCWCKWCVRARSKERWEKKAQAKLKKAGNEKVRVINQGQIVDEEAHERARKLLKEKREAVFGKEEATDEK